MGIILTPPEYRKHDHPSIFLAGPIQGTDDWQDRACGIIHSLDPDMIIANPRRAVEFEGEFSETMYAEQVDWETHHLRQAAVNGTILFWLGREGEHSCKRAYAQTTRFELGEWFSWYRRQGKRFAIGIEDGYTGARYVRRRLSQDVLSVVLRDSLEQTCEDAVGIITGLYGASRPSRERRFTEQDSWLKRDWR